MKMEQFPDELLKANGTAAAYIQAHREEIERAKANGWTWAQIAEAIGLSQHTLKTTYHRLKKSDQSRRQAPKSPKSSPSSPVRKPVNRDSGKITRTKNPTNLDTDEDYFSWS